MSFSLISPADLAKKCALFAITETHYESQKYIEHYSTTSKAVEIDGKAKDWATDNEKLNEKNPKPSKEELNAIFWPRIEAYIEYRSIRDNTLALVQLFDTAIAFCQHSSPTELGQLNASRTEWQDRYEKIKTALVALKVSGEYLARMRADYTIASATFIPVNETVGIAKYFSAAVDERVAEKTQKKVEPKDEKKQPDLPPLGSVQEPDPKELAQKKTV